MKELRFNIHGTFALLMNNPASMTAGPQTAGRKVIPTPEEEAKRGLYKDDNGNLYVPAVGVRNGVLKGSTGLKSGRVFLKTAMTGSLMLYTERFPLLRPDGSPITDYDTIDQRRVVIGKAGIIRSRSQIDLNWMVPCSFWFDEEVLQNLDDVKKCISIGGKTAGLCDYRPEKGGWFGRYQLGDLEVLDLD